jgi:hypothetical protein
LFAAVKPARLQQFFGADDAERLEEFRADHVLPAFAAIERKIGDARLLAPRQTRDERRVFIIRVRARVQRARSGLQTAQQLTQTERAPIINGTHLRPRRVPLMHGGKQRNAGQNQS